MPAEPVGGTVWNPSMLSRQIENRGLQRGGQQTETYGGDYRQSHESWAAHHISLSVGGTSILTCIVG